MSISVHPPRRQRRVLLVEDNPGDVWVLQKSWTRLAPGICIAVVSTGDDALDYLRHAGKFGGSPAVDLVFLDLNLPCRSGREVLVDIRSDPKLLHLPVVVMTSSVAEEDVANLYGAGASAFFLKPIPPAVLDKIVGAVVDVWFTLGRLP